MPWKRAESEKGPSKVIDQYSYDPEKRELTVRFKTGTSYKYEDVDSGIVSDLDNPKLSTGKIFHQKVKPLKFTKLPEEK